MHVHLFICLYFGQWAVAGLHCGDESNTLYTTKFTYSDIISSNILRIILTGPGYLYMCTCNKCTHRMGKKISIWFGQWWSTVSGSPAQLLGDVEVVVLLYHPTTKFIYKKHIPQYDVEQVCTDYAYTPCTSTDHFLHHYSIVNARAHVQTKNLT